MIHPLSPIRSKRCQIPLFSAGMKSHLTELLTCETMCVYVDGDIDTIMVAGVSDFDYVYVTMNVGNFRSKFRHCTSTHPLDASRSHTISCTAAIVVPNCAAVEQFDRRGRQREQQQRICACHFTQRGPARIFCFHCCCGWVCFGNVQERYSCAASGVHHASDELLSGTDPGIRTVFASATVFHSVFDSFGLLYSFTFGKPADKPCREDLSLIHI